MKKTHFERTSQRSAVQYYICTEQWPG